MWMPHSYANATHKESPGDLNWVGLSCTFSRLWQNRGKTHRESSKISDDSWRNHNVTNDIDNLSIKLQDWFVPADLFVTKSTNQLQDEKEVAYFQWVSSCKKKIPEISVVMKRRISAFSCLVRRLVWEMRIKAHTLSVLSSTFNRFSSRDWKIETAPAQKGTQ